MFIGGDRVGGERSPAPAGVVLETGMTGGGVFRFGVEDLPRARDFIYGDVLFDAVFKKVPIPEGIAVGGPMRPNRRFENRAGGDAIEIMRLAIAVHDLGACRLIRGLSMHQGTKEHPL